MSNQAKIVIDASLFAQPKLDCNEKEAESYANALFNLVKLNNGSIVSYFKIKNLVGDLIQAGVYPKRNQLDQIFTKNGIRFRGNDFMVYIENLIRNSIELETYFDIEDLEVSGLTSTPDITSASSSEILKVSLERCIALVVVLSNPEYHRTPQKNLILMTKNSLNFSVKIVVQSCTLLHQNGNISIESLMENSIDGKIPICGDVGGVFEYLDEVSILQDAIREDEDGRMIEFATKIAWYSDAINNRQSPEWNSDIYLSTNDNFRKDFKSVCGKQNEKFLRNVLYTIVSAINRSKLCNPHPVRESKGGRDVVRENGDRLIRRDVTSDAHLHYWECSDGTTELEAISSSHDQNLP